MRAFKQSDAPEEEHHDDHGRLDAVRSWLASGNHIFGVDPRRRRGHHGHAKQLLADDHRASQDAPGEWQALASALDRHTVRGGMTELSPEERSVITLAYLEGRSNREIASIMGLSVSTVRRRLWIALKRLDAYISRTGTWLSALMLLGVGYAIARFHKLERAANADWTHKVASTVAVATVTAVTIGLTAVTPDSRGSTVASTPAPAPMIAASPGVGLPASPALLSSLDSAHTSTMLPADRSTGAGGAVRVKPRPPANETQPVTRSHHPNRGCHGNPTSAPPPVPVGRHANGSPVTHPSAGGCRA